MPGCELQAIGRARTSRKAAFAPCLLFDVVYPSLAYPGRPVALSATSVMCIHVRPCANANYYKGQAAAPLWLESIGDWLHWVLMPGLDEHRPSRARHASDSWAQRPAQPAARRRSTPCCRWRLAVVAISTSCKQGV